MRAPYRAQRAPGGVACSPSSSRSTASRSARARTMEMGLRHAETGDLRGAGVVGRSAMVLRGCFLRGAEGEAACEQAEQSEHMVMEGNARTSSHRKHSHKGLGGAADRIQAERCMQSFQASRRGLLLVTYKACYSARSKEDGVLERLFSMLFCARAREQRTWK